MLIITGDDLLQFQSGTLITTNGKDPIRILHVDDDPSILEISKQILLDIGGFEIDNTYCVDEAFKKLATQKYDIVISDYEMPQKDGLQFLKELRERKNEIPFILFTGKGREEVAIRALNLGSNRYINKQGAPETVYTELVSGVIQAVEHSKTQSLLQMSNERFSLLSTATYEGIGFSEEGKIVDANNQLENMLGYDHSELLGLNVVDLISPESRDFVQGRIKSGAEGPYECLMVKKDGSVLPVEVRAKNMTYKGHLGRVCTIRDITDRKKAEEERESSEIYLKTIFTSVSTGIMIINAETHEIVDINPYALDAIGASKEQTTGKICHKFVCPADKGKCPISDLGQVVDKSERTLLSLNGEKIPILKTVVKISWKGQKYLIESFINITERKKAEENLKRAMNQLVILNEKLNVVGSLTRHDVRNKLSALNGYAYLLKKKHAGQAEVVEGLGKIEQVVAESTKILEFSRMYEQLGVEKLTNVDVGKAVDEAVALFSGLNIKVVNNCHGLSVLADSFLRQMFYNLIDNTRKYGEKATTIKVYFEQEGLDGLRLVYEDDGVGISEENKSKLFNEGFSTGGSTGFGLFLIKKMMEVYGWSITEEGEPGKGAKFVITIPNR